MTDLCNQIGWNPIAVGRSHSALAAVIAGFLFTGAILLLGLDSRSERHPKVLGLLASSFFVLLLDSFLFSVVGGEQICNRAWTELMIAAGLLGVGSLGMFGGIAWLLVEKDYSGSPALRLILIIAYSISAIVIFHLQVTALYYLHDVFEPNSPPTWLIATTWASISVIALCLIGVVLIRRRLRRGAANDVIFRAAYASVAYGIGASVMFGGLGARSEWSTTPTWVVALAVFFSLSLSGLAVAAHVAALPFLAGPVSTQLVEDGESSPPGDSATETPITDESISTVTEQRKE